MASDTILTFDEFQSYLQLKRSVPKHDVQTEQMPNHPWFTLDKVVVDSRLRDFASSVSEPMKRSPESDSELQHIKRTGISMA